MPSRPFVLDLFALTPLVQLHLSLIYALLLTVNALELTAFCYANVI
jgi:hypothetical protein